MLRLLRGFPASWSADLVAKEPLRALDLTAPPLNEPSAVQTAGGDFSHGQSPSPALEEAMRMATSGAAHNLFCRPLWGLSASCHCQVQSWVPLGSRVC